MSKKYKYKVTGEHSWTNKFSRKIMYPYCMKCGLIALKNEASRKAVDKPCPGREDYENE